MAALPGHHPNVTLDVTLNDRVVDWVEEGYDVADWRFSGPDGDLHVRVHPRIRTNSGDTCAVSDAAVSIRRMDDPA